MNWSTDDDSIIAGGSQATANRLGTYGSSLRGQAKSSGSRSNVLAVSLPTAYLTSTKNVDGILSAIQTAQAPPRFTLSFLENLGYKSSSDRLFINVLKALRFLNADGVPGDRYYRFLDQSEAPKVLAEGLQEAYADLYQLNRNAHQLGRTDIKNKLKTLTQGQSSDSVLTKMAGTFLELAKRADFSGPAAAQRPHEPTEGEDVSSTPEADAGTAHPPSALTPAASRGIPLGGLVYSIQIHLPESRDQAVYDALFNSLKAHLLS